MDSEHVITREDFEAWMNLMRTTKAFVFAHYKGRWVAADCEKEGGGFLYTVYGSQTDVLMSECIVKISVPEKPQG